MSNKLVIHNNIIFELDAEDETKRQAIAFKEADIQWYTFQEDMSFTLATDAEAALYDTATPDVVPFSKFEQSRAEFEANKSDLKSFLSMRDSNSNTRLMMMATNGVSTFPKVVEIAVAQGVDLNQANRAGNTVLHFAVEHGQLDATRALVGKGANPFIANAEGKKPSDVAAMKGQTTILSYLRSIESEMNINGVLEENAEPVQPEARRPKVKL